MNKVSNKEWMLALDRSEPTSQFQDDLIYEATTMMHACETMVRLCRKGSVNALEGYFNQVSISMRKMKSILPDFKKENQFEKMRDM